jgi:hypothetical protein
MAVIDAAHERITNFAPAGTTQATATPVKHKHVLTSTFAITATGALLQQQFCAEVGEGTIHNGNSETSTNLEIYPWSGAAFNGRSANASLSLPPGKGCRWVYLNSTTIGIIYA